jgi:uncharacterized protein (DUF2132 family)
LLRGNRVFLYLVKRNDPDKKMSEQKNNPLHGITLERILVQLVDYYGWDELGYKININSFNNDPSINSSLKFLRKTPWARQKVEDLYVRTFSKK